MKKNLRYLAFLLIASIFSVATFAQSNTISGTVKSSVSKEAVAAVSVIIQGSSTGTFTDDKGAFKLVTTHKFPLTLVLSSVGFDTKELALNSASENVEIEIVPGSTLGTEVVVSASRVPERILESPVSIERMGTSYIRNAAVPNYYDATANLKGVDLTTSSLTFRTVSTRGFNGSGNLRFNQLVDGIDNQAPGLNFAVGNIVGPTELDVDNVELLPGASSALYGSGGMNGTLLVSSKNPFKYQGLSFQVKQGMMHTDGKERPISPYYDWALRWGKQVSEKFAFKIGAQFLQAKDWEANDERNLLRNNVFSTIKAGDRNSDPNYNGINVFGDEASASMNYIAQAVRGQVGLNPMAAPALAYLDGLINAGLNYQGIKTQMGLIAPTLVPYLQFLVPTSGVANNGFRNTYGSQFVSRTGYAEKDVVDYNTYNVKLTGGLYYKLTDNVEASLLAYWGTGTTVYTGADRYAIKNLKMGQYKAEVKGKNWFLRGYTVQENSGDAYTATTAALFINRVFKSDLNWFQDYTGAYGLGRLESGASDAQATAGARAFAEAGRFLPGTPQYNAAFNQAKVTSINKGGAKFEDRTDLYHLEGQYNFDKVKVVDLMVGASYQLYRLNSQGTIFVDTTGPISINEYGGYAQVQKWLLNEKLKLSGSIRYDKSQNFKGRFTPRITALFKVTENNNIRLSFQTAYRFPATQDQYINLLTGGSNRLIGGLPEFNTYFRFNTSPAYTAESIDAYRNSIAGGAINPTLLQTAQFQKVKPETMNSFELGYKGLLTRRLLVDLYGYYSMYKDFIGRVAVGRGVSEIPANAPKELASPFTTNNYSFVYNATNTVKAIGWGIGLNYQVIKGFEINANISSDQLKDVPSTLFTQFNTPKLRYNIGFGNQDLGKGVGFNIVYRWQDKVNWQGTFATGDIGSFNTLDAQVSYKFPKTKNLFKVGASNLLNKYYASALGNPQVGGLYYVSFGYNVF